MKIGKFEISSKSPFFVAEISGNHAGKYSLLEKTILAEFQQWRKNYFSPKLRI